MATGRARLIDTALTRNEGRYQQALVAKTPLCVPWVKPEDVAPAVVFLASGEARMVSGVAYDVTGGDSAHAAS